MSLHQHVLSPQPPPPTFERLFKIKQTHRPVTNFSKQKSIPRKGAESTSIPSCVAQLAAPVQTPVSPQKPHRVNHRQCVSCSGSTTRSRVCTLRHAYRVAPGAACSSGCDAQQCDAAAVLQQMAASMLLARPHCTSHHRPKLHEPNAPACILYSSKRPNWGTAQTTHHQATLPTARPYVMMCCV